MREGTFVSFRILIHRDWKKLLSSDVFCFGNFWRYIGNRLYWPIPMYILNRFETPYIGMGIEISIPMYRLLKLEQQYIGKALNGGISDVCSKNHTFWIHRDSTKISDSDVF